MNLPAGNWDAEFVENPEVLDVDRNTRGHLGFGYGVHQCIGANLARVEMQIAFATLARRVPGLRFAVHRRAVIQRRIRYLRHERVTRRVVSTSIEDVRDTRRIRDEAGYTVRTGPPTR